jgi:hypothetical protein
VTDSKKYRINYVRKKVCVVLDDTTLGACFIKLSVSVKAGVFDTVGHFRPSLIFASKVGAYPVGAPCGGPLRGRLLAMITNIRVG